MVRIRYDAEVDALYIRLIEEPIECRVLRLNDEVALNLGPAESLVGIEIFGSSEKFVGNVVVLGWAPGSLGSGPAPPGPRSERRSSHWPPGR